MEVEMKVIIRPSRTRLLVGILLALLLAAGIAAVMPWIRTQVEPLFLPGENSPQWAAQYGAETFYTLDYRQSPDAWVEAICAISTEGGCALTKLAAPNLWESLTEAKTRTQAQVEVVAQVKTGEVAGFSENPTQIWEVRITLSEPLPGQTMTEDTAYVAVVQAEGVWKFERILMNAETVEWNSEDAELQ
jgi:hypothetical protein